MKKPTIVTLAIGSAFAAATLSPIAHAAGDNPFSADKLQAGYQLAEADTKMKDGKCGEAKCGAAKKAAEQKAAEKKAEAKCGADKNTGMESGGKAGEAKCGANKM